LCSSYREDQNSTLMLISSSVHPSTALPHSSLQLGSRPQSPQLLHPSPDPASLFFRLATLQPPPLPMRHNLRRPRSQLDHRSCACSTMPFVHVGTW
jgi:hypothetical protein